MSRHRFIKFNRNGSDWAWWAINAFNMRPLLFWWVCFTRFRLLGGRLMFHYTCPSDFAVKRRTDILRSLYIENGRWICRLNRMPYFDIGCIHSEWAPTTQLLLPSLFWLNRCFVWQHYMSPVISSVFALAVQIKWRTQWSNGRREGGGDAGCELST